MIRHLLSGLGLAGLALVMATPLAGQSDVTTFDAARAAEARLDFRAALATYAARIAEAPDDPTPLVARAALHIRMNRRGLALADLDAALAAAPQDLPARIARADLYLSFNALTRAVDDYDAVLDADAGNVAALSGRARARARAGLSELALADYDTALALAPDTPGLAAARAALAARNAAPPPASAQFDPAQMMAPPFRIDEGAPEAPAKLVIVHAGNALAEETVLLPRATIAAARDAGTLSVTHLFTYTGDDSSIWANLALVCAGTDGFSVTWDALTGADASAALADIDAGRGRAAFDTLVSQAYTEAGLDASRGPDCAFDRGEAVRYLAAWTKKRDADAWRGRSVYESWPVFVLDGTVVPAEQIAGRLAAFAPAPAAQAEDSESPASGAVAADADATPDNGALAVEPAMPEVEAPEPQAVATVDLPADSADEPAQPGVNAEAPPPASDPIPPEPARPETAEIEAAEAIAPSNPFGTPRPSARDESHDNTTSELVTAEPVAEPDDTGADLAPEPTDLESGADSTLVDRNDADAVAEVAPESTDTPSEIGDDNIAEAAATQAPSSDEGPAEPPSEIEASEPLAERAAQPAPPRPELPAKLEPQDQDARLSADLKGIWAPSLVDCLAYSDSISAPTTIDAALPRLNPLDGPALGTVLLTSRRMILFNAVGTECDLASVSEADDAPWSARLACTNGIAPELVVPMSLARLDGGGPAPRLLVGFGERPAVELLQCRLLSLLGRDFAPLWQTDTTACRASAPVVGADFSFTAKDGTLTLTVTPDSALAPGATGQLVADVDRVLLGAPGPWGGTSWSVVLGPFDAASNRLAQGLLLDVVAEGADPAAPHWARTLPLLGSGRAMGTLADCAGN